MDKITNEDIIEALKEQDGKNWRFGYAEITDNVLIPTFCTSDKLSSRTNPDEFIDFWVIPVAGSEKFTKEDIVDTFDHLDWANAYKATNQTKECVIKTVDTKKQATIFLPKRIREIISTKLEKTADNGRDGK